MAKYFSKKNKKLISNMCPTYVFVYSRLGKLYFKQ